MHLSIHSLKKTLFDGEAHSLNCKTEAGEITVLDHHRPLISVLTQGVLKIIDKESKTHYISISFGFLEVQKDNARAIIGETIAG